MKEKLYNLKNIMFKEGIDVYVLPSNDEFSSEYPPEYAKRIEFLTNFSGSFGFLVISRNKSILFTDSRYTVQAKNQLDLDIYEVENINKIKNYDWSGMIDEDTIIGFDPNLFTKNSLDNFLKSIFCKYSTNFIPTTYNFVDKIWLDQPRFPSADIWEYPSEYAGETSENKISKFRKWMEDNEIESYILSDSESICWLLNLRAWDSEFCPILLSNLFITHHDLYLYSFNREATICNFRPIEHFENDLEEFQKKYKISLDENETNFSVISRIFSYKNKKNPCILWKASKNSQEINWAEKTHISDGISVCEFLAWVEYYVNNSDLNLKEENFPSDILQKIDQILKSHNQNSLNEFLVSKILAEFRKLQNNYISDSFSTICGFQSNGAVIHYRAQENNSKIINDNGLLLLDSGGHYYGGTTDITRTILIGIPEEDVLKKYKKFYTLVLKGHLELCKTIFPKGTKGANLDILARKYLWENKLDYGHGTGHGVGNCLNVHEKPQRINMIDFNNELVEGMIVSNEPGFYIENDFGIRIENLQYVKKIDDNFFTFEQLTLIPYTKDLIDFSLITNDEINYLKKYYEKIEKFVYPNLSNNAKNWVRYNMDIF